MHKQSAKARRGQTQRRQPPRNRGENPSDLAETERLLLARKVRGGRAVLGWSQTELGNRTGLTQTSIHRIEQGKTDLKHSTFTALERLFTAEGVTFEDTEDGFKIVIKLD
jgi:ribosome-binding protein aMBF1 (putative translation factor)